jgi:hypothetical protein
MTKVAHLRVIDANGEVVEHEDIEQENRALRAALTRAENVIKGLRANLAAERQQARKAYPIDEAFEDWKAKLVKASWVLREARAGRIPHIRMGRYVRFDPDELAAWCRSRQRGPVQRTKEAA